MPGPTTRPLNLALQGGGAHGAFTWGVLDALLEDGRLRFEAISGTSAGAMNAVMLAQGWMVGGSSGARAALRQFWMAVAALVPQEMSRVSSNGEQAQLSPAMQWMMQWTQLLAPEQLNPFDVNPLRTVLQSQVDFEGLRKHCPVSLFLAATKVRSGQLRVFRESELSLDVLLASACLPTMHRTVEIEGEPYWDGGYSANPPIWALLEAGRCRDVLLVLLNPLQQHTEVSTAAHIRVRTGELAFQAGFLREMQLLTAMRQEVSRSWFVFSPLARRLRNARFHWMQAGDVLSQWGSPSKSVVNSRFFELLFAHGREHAQTWLSQSYTDVGRCSSVDLAQHFAPI